MSGRGRGGRGRGRGRGAPPSGAKLLLMRSAQESGLGDHNLKSLTDITKPALFPEMVWNYQVGSEVSKAKQSSAVYLINKGREIDHRFQTSSHWVRPSQTQVDVVRYQSEKRSHRVAQMPSHQAVLEQIGKNLALEDSYTPQELVPNSNKGKRSQSDDSKEDDDAKRKPAFDDLEKKETQKRREEARNANVLDEKGAEGQFSDAPTESDSEGEDYVKDYVESEEDSDGGGDSAEATF